MARDFSRIECPYVDFWNLMGTLDRVQEQEEQEDGIPDYDADE